MNFSGSFVRNDFGITGQTDLKLLVEDSEQKAKKNGISSQNDV